MSGTGATHPAAPTRPGTARLSARTLRTFHLGLAVVAVLAGAAAFAVPGLPTVVRALPFITMAVSCAVRGREQDEPWPWFALSAAGLAAVAAVASGAPTGALGASSGVESIAISLFAVLLGAGCVGVVTPRLRPVTLRRAADGAVVGLSTMALVTAATVPSVRSAAGVVIDGTLGAVPGLPLVLVAIAFGVVGVGAGRAGRTWYLLGPALAAPWLGDLAALVLDDSALAERLCLALWSGAAVLAVVAAALDDVDEPVREHERSVVGLPEVMALAALAIVAWSVVAQVPEVVLLPAVATLAAVAASSLLIMREVRSLTDSRRQARTDDLTGLANRRYFYERLSEALEDRDPADNLALLIVDLDRFKEINDSLGHHTGDQVLRLIGPRLTPAVGVWDVLARLGGDEFAVLVEGGDHEWAIQTAHNLRAALADPFPVGEVQLHVDASVGIAMWPDHADNLDELLARADIAMYLAKAERSGVRTYEDRDDAPTRERLHLLELIRTAVSAQDPADEGLLLHYQPKLHVASGEVEGVEALVRFDHPDGTLLFPDLFISMVENAGLMQQLTLSVLRTAIAQCREWRSRGIVLNMAVNVSTSNLLDLAFPHQVMHLLKAHDLPPSALVIEITESSFMRDRVRCLEVLHRLRAVGVKISVDDYGTGHSSLAYLKDLPADELKLDRTFVQGMAEDTRVGSIVESTVKLAHALDLRIVAEGVEVDGDLDRLRNYGVDVVQGYLFSRPLSTEEFQSWYLATYCDMVEVPDEPAGVSEVEAPVGGIDEPARTAPAGQWPDGGLVEPEFEIQGIDWIPIEPST